MKTTVAAIFVFIMIFCSACHDPTAAEPMQALPERSIQVTIQLADSLGNISLRLPARYDTNFVWTDHSDCGKPCDKIKYRYQPKNLTTSKESGWIWLNGPTDSVERFTISHSGYFPFHETNDSSFIYRYHDLQKGNIVQNPSTFKIKTDTVEKINGRYYSIFTIDLYDPVKTQYSKKLLAATGIKANIIEISFELLSKQKDSLTNNFLKNSILHLRSVKLSKL